MNRFTNSSYTVLASFSNTTQLQDGVPQVGQIGQAGTLRYYALDTGMSGTHAWTFALTPLSGATVYMLVALSFVFSSSNPYPITMPLVRLS